MQSLVDLLMQKFEKALDDDTPHRADERKAFVEFANEYLKHNRVAMISPAESFNYVITLANGDQALFAPETGDKFPAGGAYAVTGVGAARLPDAEALPVTGRP